MAMLACGLCSGAWAQSESGAKRANPFEMLSFDGAKVPRWISEAVIQAAEKTGVDPAFVMALADKESSFEPRSKARTSSAEGLFQFLEGTWLQVMKVHGEKHGFGDAADAIKVSDGRYTVEDADEKAWILGLRQDPFLSAVMACEMLKQSRERLTEQTRRAPTKGELYLAHFLGTNGAGRLLKLMAANPAEKATKAFPSAAGANKAVFSADAKTAKQDATVAQVHARITAMIEKRLSRYSGLSTEPASAERRGGQIATAARL
jgi:Transglycosylase SLT domain